MSDEVPWSDYLADTITASDIKFIRDSWLASYRTSPWSGAIPNNLFTEVMGQALDQLFMRGMRVLVIRNPANPELLIGWGAYEVNSRGELTIHYLYTKAPYRKHGAARALLAAIQSRAGAERYFYTFKTPASRYFAGTFRPEIARRKNP